MKIKMKQKLIGMALFFLLATTGIKAQDSTSHMMANPLPYVPKWEVTSNITLALSRFTGNVSRNLNDDPYLLMVRKFDPTGMSALRMGINGFRRKSEDVNGGFGGEVTRSSEENWASLVIGKEWRRNLGSGFYAFGGFDGRGIYRNSQSKSVQFDGWSRTEIITNASEFGGSAGGFGGIGVKLHDRIVLYTESIIFAQMLQTERSFSVNGSNSTLESKTTFSVIPMVPIALFLTVQF